MGAGAVIGGIAVLVIAGILDVKYISPWVHAAASGVPTQFWNPMMTLAYFGLFPFVISVVLVVAVVGAILGGGRR